MEYMRVCPKLTNFQNKAFPKIRDGAKIEFFGPKAVKNGTSITSGNSSGFIYPGLCEGKQGFFHINLNNQTGIVYHRCFYPLKRCHQMYVGEGTEKAYFFNEKVIWK